MPVTNEVLPDATPIEEVVSSERAAKHLRANGFPTLGHVREVGLSSAAAVRYVGTASVDELRRAVGTVAAPEASDEPEEDAKDYIEESNAPLRLSSPFLNLCLAWCPSNKVTTPGGVASGAYAVQEPIFVEFEQGHAKITRTMFFMRKYGRDRIRVEQAEQANEPWRKDCAHVVKSYSRYGIDFFIESD